MCTDETQRRERTRILEMVESGTVTPEEGDRLLESLEQRTGPRLRCPYCAEEIPAQTAICPECNSTLGGRQTLDPVQPTGQGFYSLTGLGKFLVCYMFLICGLVWVFSIGRFSPCAAPSMMLALLGIAGAVLVCKGSRTGWVLGTIWAAVQIVPVIVNGLVLNQQILHVGINWVTNGSGVGFNAVGLVLTVLFIKAMPSGPVHDVQGRN